MDLKIAGRAALVGGASSGIGLACTRALAAEGVRVAMVARRAELLAEQAKKIADEFGVETLPVRADLLESGECERAVDEAARRFGALDIVIANAGGPRSGQFMELSDADWERAFRLSFLTTARLARAALPHMQKGGWGRVVVIGSLVTVEPRPELTLSSAVRPGLVALVRMLGRTNGRSGILVNMVSPGYTRTDRMIEV